MKQIFDLFKNTNYEIRMVGGCVRDVFLKNTPKDIDFATNATPDQIMELGKQNNITVIPTGLHHGTVTWVIDKVWYEITTLRIDAICDGRHAEVKFTSDWKEDAKRRDFTFNAMSMDENGKIFDYFNGQEDLQNGIVRFVGNANQRIQEDYLRILRAFRFSARYGFEIANLNEIQQNVNGLKQISNERIWNELNKIFSSDRWFETVKIMHDVGVLKVFGLDFINNFTTAKGVLFRMSKVFNKENMPAQFKASMNERKEYAFDMTLSNDWDTDDNIQLHRSRGISEAWLKNALVNNNGDIFNENAPVFPLNGEMLINRGFVPGIKMGKFLKQARLDWEESNFTKTVSDFF